MSRGAGFWNRFADRYAARPIKDIAAYEALLADAALRLKPEDRVSEIGCGTGGTAIRLAEGVAHYIATDFSAEMIRIASAKPTPQNLHFMLAEASALPDGGPFDAVCAFNVLHLVDDLPCLLSNIHDGLAPNGLLICKTWCFGDLPLRLRLLFRTLRLVGLFPPAQFLTEPELHQVLQAAGFTNEATQVFGARTQNPYIVARATKAPRDDISLPQFESHQP